MPVSDGVWAGWVSKEFTRSMQAKGKMEVAQTIAKDKRNEAFNGVKVGRCDSPLHPSHPWSVTGLTFLCVQLS